jgi:putative membrane protein
MGGRLAKIVVVAVDYDDDISLSGFETPIIGYENVVNASVKFGTLKPDDSDLNVLFHALSTYSSLKDRGEDVEVAVISGHPESHVEAGKRIRAQAEYLVSILNSRDFILVLDSVEDELVIPVIQGIANIVALERVVVEQLRGVEETYILFGRYLRKAIEEPRFSKVILGIPGILLLVFAVLSLTPLSMYVWEVIVGLLGALLLIRGFQIHEVVAKKWRQSSIYRVSGILAIFSLVVGIALTVVSAASRNFSYDPLSVRTYAEVVVPFIALSVSILFTGRLINRVLRRSIRVWRDIVAVLVTVLLARYVLNLIEVITFYPPDEIVKALYEYNLIQIFALISVLVVAIVFLMSFIEYQMKLTRQT